MGWLSKVLKKPSVILKNPTKILVPPLIIPGDIGAKTIDKVTDGQEPGAAAKDAASEAASDVGNAVGDLAEIEQKVQVAKSDLIGRIGGKRAQAVFNDVEKLSKPADATTASASILA